MEQNEDDQARRDEELRHFCLEQAVKVLAHRQHSMDNGYDWEKDRRDCKVLKLANYFFAYVREGKTDEPNWYFI